MTGSIALKCPTFWQEYLVLQDRWPVMAVVSRQVSLYSSAPLIRPPNLPRICGHIREVAFSEGEVNALTVVG